MARDYQPTLRFYARRLNIFIARWREKLMLGMSPEQAAALAAFETVLVELLDALGVAPIDP